jgi:FkbM family methyltransferase
MKKTLSFLIVLLSKIIGRKNLESFLIYCAKSINVNLHIHGLLQIGAGTNIYLENGSELVFIKNILAAKFANKGNPVFFDVGANIGNYSLMLKQHIPNATIHSFEPVEETFEQLEKNIGSKTILNNVGFGALPGKGTLYNTINSTISEIATTHKDIIPEVFRNRDKLIAIEFDVDTIDNYCVLNDIQKIDFLKIDVEGNELAVLQGATEMISNDCIEIIQFEFNTHNIYSRVFLRDFYLLLKDYNFYRLNRKGILALGNYKPSNEIFTAQNLLAVHKNVSVDENCEYLLSL